MIVRYIANVFNIKSGNKFGLKVITACAYCLLIPNTQSAMAEVYGPPDNSVKIDQSFDQSKDNYPIVTLPVKKINRNKSTVRDLEILYQSLGVLDASETISCVHKSYCAEGNPILGKKPSNSSVIAFKAVAAGLHYLAYRYEIRHSVDHAMIFEVGTNVLQGIVCGLNLRYAF